MRLKFFIFLDNNKKNLLNKKKYTSSFHTFRRNADQKCIYHIYIYIYIYIYIILYNIKIFTFYFYFYRNTNYSSY